MISKKSLNEIESIVRVAELERIEDFLYPCSYRGHPWLKFCSMELLHQQITEQIIGAAFEVHRELGYGFLERVYQRAMQVELRLRGLSAEIESEIRVSYKGVDVGHYQADLFVEACVLVELKVAKNYVPDDEPQLLNELKATGVKVGLLINFGKSKVEFKRFVLLTFKIFAPCADFWNTNKR